MGAKATKLGHVLCSTVMSQNSLAAIDLFLFNTNSGNICLYNIAATKVEILLQCCTRCF